MKVRIPDSDLTIDSLPSIDDSSAIFAFAMTFDGYEHFGSAEAAGSNARARPRSSLADLRNELFISCRKSRHQDNDGFLDTYRELLPLFREALRRV